MHPILLLVAYVCITIAPLALAYIQDLPPRPVQDEIGSGLAMVAFAILLAEFLLSGRFRTITARMGMDVTMRLHQLLARTALVFVLVHPFLYSTPLNRPLPWDVTRQLTLGLDTASIATGVLAWLALAVLVLLAIYRDRLEYRYETWRLMHGIGAIVIAGAATHHTLMAGRYSADPVLAGFWLLLLVVAIGSLTYTYLIAPLREGRHPYEVISLKKIALKTWELTIRSKKGDGLPFDAGQFVWLNVGKSPFTLYENPFSISSAPAQSPDVQFTIKEVGDMTRAVGDIAPGTTAYLDGPHGNLTLRGRKGRGVALIAGGVGIAPLISIARQMRADGDPRPLMLLYGNRVCEQIAYADELEDLSREANVQVAHILSEPPRGWKGLTGKIDRTVIQNAFTFDGARDWIYLLCGPPAMLDTVEDALVALGIPAGQIVSERFYYD